MMMTKKEKRRVPELRFVGFEGEWEKSKIAKDCNVLMCKRIFASETNENEGVPFYKIGTIGSTPDAFISNKLFKEYRNKYNYPRKGEILITCSGTVGKCIPFNGEDAYFQDSNIVWIDNPTSNIINEYLYYVLSNYNWRKLNSTTITRIYGSDLRSLIIIHPQQEEQQKIATFLTTIDTRIQQLEKKKTLLEQYKKGVMQKIFSQEIRFKDDDGKEFGKWEKKRFEELGEIITGKTPSTSNPDLWNGDIHFVTPTDIDGNKYQYKTQRTVARTSKMKVLPLKSILFTCIASIGKMSLSTKPCITNQQINSIVPYEEFDNEFVYYSLLNMVEYIKSTQSTNTLPIINKTEFSKFKINVPKDLEEQTKIAHFLSALDTKIAVTSEQVERTKEWKKGLLQQMFV